MRKSYILVFLSIFFAVFVIIKAIFSPIPVSKLTKALVTETDQTTIKKDSSFTYKNIQGALLGTRFKSYDEFKERVKIYYFDEGIKTVFYPQTRPMAFLVHEGHTQKAVSKLSSGITEKDIIRARDGDFWDKAYLAFHSPYFVWNRWDVLRIFIFSRRRGQIFGVGDVAFYDLAEHMMKNITMEDSLSLPAKDFSEKGFINTFNHISSQAFMTTLFSEEMADFIADIHERATMPELITGDFTEEQIIDLEFGALDNYVDIINNEWGQELGKQLQKKYQINRKTEWTPQLLANYLNDLQSYYSWALQVGFHPFKPTDEVIIRFTYKLNRVMEKVKGMS
jgi:hypothetical protein